jgi:hypothetical protein
MAALTALTLLDDTHAHLQQQRTQSHALSRSMGSGQCVASGQCIATGS